MNWPKPTQILIRKLDRVQRDLEDLFVGRARVVRLLALAVVCREHLLLIGPPGTAKTELVNRFAAMVDARGFHYLLTRFTEPSELFGPVDMKAFKEGVYKVAVAGMLPQAEIAFLDEVFQGSSAILNTLLGLANERVFHNGATVEPAPLLTLIGAANHLPDDPGLDAFVDRFILRHQLDNLEDGQLDELLEEGWQLELARMERALAPDRQARDQQQTPLKRADLDQLHRCLGQVQLDEVRPHYAALVRDLRNEGVTLSDRRVVRGLKLVAGAAVLRGAAEAAPCDLWPLEHLWSREPEMAVVANVVTAVMDSSGAVTPSAVREVADILADLAVLERRRAGIRNEVAMGAHLMELNQLRRELLRDHHEAAQARAAVDEAINVMMTSLEGNHV